MKKELYKLIIVFTMIVFAFSLAFFLGRETALFPKTKPKTFADVFNPTVGPSPAPKKSPAPSFTASDREKPTQRIKVKEYKKTLKPGLTAPTGPGPTPFAPQLPEPPHIYALLVAVHNDKDTAVEKATNLKSRFPEWKIFFKKNQDSYKVYIGPFREKKKAEDFLKKVQTKPGLSTVKVEKL